MQGINQSMCIETTTSKTSELSLLTQKIGSNFAFSDTMQWETNGVLQGMGIMHSNVIDTVFYSSDAWDSLPSN